MNEQDAILADAARAIIDRIAALGHEFVCDNPYKSPTSEAEQAKEADLRELAAAVRNLRPTFDALARSIEPARTGRKPEGENYKFGFLLRLLEQTLDIAAIAGARRVKDALRERNQSGGIKSGEKRAETQAVKWANEGKSIALTYVADHPDASQDKIATEITFRLDDRCPAHRQVKTCVARWQKDGVLPRPDRK